MIKLNEGLTFDIEKQDKRIRIIIYNSAGEFVCRKSSLSELAQLTQTDNLHLFKGRLQLHRLGNEVTVQVKGKPAGVIDLKEFKQLI